MASMGELLRRYVGKRASVNMKESEIYGWFVIDVEPKKRADRSIYQIHDVDEDMLVLDVYDKQELHFIPLEKIGKVNVNLRDT